MAVKDKLVTLEDLQTAYNDLKEAIGNMESAAAKITLASSTSDYTISSSGDFNCVARAGKVVHIILDIGVVKAVSAGNVPAGTTVATIPEGFRPVSEKTLAVNGVTTGVGSEGLVLHSNGNITLKATAGNFSGHINGFYVCA